MAFLSIAIHSHEAQAKRREPQRYAKHDANDAKREPQQYIQRYANAMSCRCAFFASEIGKISKTADKTADDFCKLLIYRMSITL